VYSIEVTPEPVYSAEMLMLAASTGVMVRGRSGEPLASFLHFAGYRATRVQEETFHSGRRGMSIKITLLSEITAQVDRRLVDLGFPQRKYVLAVLAVDAGRLVPADG
jgi:hypothetical protein